MIEDDVEAGIDRKEIERGRRWMSDEERYVWVMAPEIYVNEKGQRVTKRRVVKGVAPEDFAEYIGYGRISIEQGQRSTWDNFDFLIPGAKNLEEAFAGFEEHFNAAAEIRRAQLLGPKILTAKFPGKVC